MTFVSAGSFAVLPANAQSSGADQLSSLNAEAPYDDSTLQSFATAAAGVLALRNHYYPRIRAAEIAGSNDKADLLFTEMRKRMNAAIRNVGFSEVQYRAISNAAKTDDDLRQRINAILQGSSPAQQHARNVRRVTPKPPKTATAPAPTPAPTPAPAVANAAPATPVIDPANANASAKTEAGPSAEDAERKRLEAELSKANEERERYQAEQAALQDKMTELERELTTVKTQEAARRKRLAAQKAKARAEQKKAKAELDALHGEVTTLKDELSAAQSHDTVLREQLEAQRVRADAEEINKEAKLAAFRHEIKRLAGRLVTAQQALDSMATELKPSAGANRRPTPPFEALEPLRAQPNSIERLLAKAGPQYALQQELDSEIARFQKERQARDVERSALQQEIAELSRDLSSTYQAMADLTGESTRPAAGATDLDIQDGIYALDVSQETAQLFEMGPPQFEPAPEDPQAGVLLDDPVTLDVGDSVIEPGASATDDGAALEPGTFTPVRVNPAPAAQIAKVPAPATEIEVSAAEDRPTHQIVRDEEAFNPAAQPVVEPLTPETAPPADYPNSVGGGGEAYRAGNFSRAYDIWTGLAEAGSRGAQFHLGALYFEGRGTSVDYGQAYFWLQVSAYQGDQRALNLLAAVAEKLTGAEIVTSENQARDWLQQRSIEVTQIEQDGSNRL